MLTAFLDESGTDDRGLCVTVAGFYGDEAQWQTFRDLWKPRSEGFHALNSSSRFGPLCDAIEASKIQGIFVTVWKATYKALANEHLKSFAGNGYAVCAFLCAMQICQEVEGVPISFAYELGQPNFEFVKRVLEAMKDSGEYSIASALGAKKADFIELHPADFVSHCATGYKKEFLQRLFNSKLLKHGHVAEEMLKQASAAVTEFVKKAKNERLKAKKQGRNN